jgi:hypothetical protein
VNFNIYLDNEIGAALKSPPRIRSGRHLLDTTVVSDFTRRDPAVLNRLKAASKDYTAICMVTAMEVAYRLMLNPARARAEIQQPSAGNPLDVLTTPILTCPSTCRDQALWRPLVYD